MPLCDAREGGQRRVKVSQKTGLDRMNGMYPGVRVLADFIWLAV